MKDTFFILKIFFFTALACSCLPAARAQLSDFPTLDSLPAALDSLPEYEVRILALRLASQAADIRDVYTRKERHAALEREVLAGQLADSEADSLATKEERKAIGNALKAAKRAEKDAQDQIKKAEKAVELALKVAEMAPAELVKNLPKAYKNTAALIPKAEAPEETPIAEVIGAVAVSEPAGTEPSPADAEPIATEQPPATEPEKSAGDEKKQAPGLPPVKAYDPAVDVMLNPPARPCAFSADTRDAFSGERRRETQKEELFRFTNPSLRAYFQDRDHIICEASISSNSNAFFLNLNFTINDVNAQRAFGSLPRNGIAMLKLLDGETVTLINLRPDEGKAADDKLSFAFSGQYALEPGMLKKLQKTLLDKIRIAWGTGYEDYDIYNVDFLARQLGCLLKN